MKIAIDISQIVYGTGVSVYTKELVKNLIKFDQKNNYLLFGSSLRRKNDIDDFVKDLRTNIHTNFEYKYLPIPPTFSDVLWNRFRKVKIERFIGDVDVLHTSDWSLPPTNAKVVCTIHDLVPILYPKLSNPQIVRVHTRFLDLARSNASKVIAPSRTTKSDLVKLGFRASKIKIIPEAVSSRFVPLKEYQIEGVKKQYGIKGKYIFTVGLGKRKNTENLIKAFRKSVLGFDVSLVVAGTGEILDDWRADNVKFLGYVEDVRLPALYTGAQAFVYPSLYEGFGLPILESFACHTPVVTSNVGSMKEIARGAAILVDPNDVISISNGIKKSQVVSDKLVKQGIERLKDYSWEFTARKTVELYNSL